MQESSEYLRGYRDAINVVLAKVRADPLIPQGSSVALHYQDATDIEAYEVRGSRLAHLKSVEEKLVTALREITRLTKKGA